MTLTETLKAATEALSQSDSARLDAEVLLAELLHCTRAHLIADAERELTADESRHYQQWIEERKAGKPVAYIIGHKEFWSLDLKVSPDALVPRPETELLVELLLQFFPHSKSMGKLADLGVGSGALALAFAKERPLWEVYATDHSPAALKVASQNARQLVIPNVKFRQGSWCQALPETLFDVIVSNPPYLSESEWQEGPRELSFEPQTALVSSDEGLSDLKTIIECSKNYLVSGGLLLLEHGYAQGQAVREIFMQEGYAEVRSYYDLAHRERATLGQWA